jgi:hypothetical protein
LRASIAKGIIVAAGNLVLNEVYYGRQERILNRCAQVRLEQQFVGTWQLRAMKVINKPAVFVKHV